MFPCGARDHAGLRKKAGVFHSSRLAMFVTVINDCRDANALVRQSIRLQAAFGCGVSAAGVENDLEAAGNLIDALDAARGAEGFILVNVAPRNGRARRWSNGSPFCMFSYGSTTVLSSVDGRTLSLAKRLGALTDVRLLDLPRVLFWAAGRRRITKEEVARIERTQFRSFEFLPLCATWTAEGEELPSEPLDTALVEEAPDAVWWVDNFGNCKTTVPAREAGNAPLAIGDALAPRHARLKDVPDGALACVVGSSGLGQDRFLEIVVQGGDAAGRLGARSCSPVRILKPLTVSDGPVW